MAKTPPKISRAISDPARPASPAKKRNVDFDLLSDDDKARIRKEAQEKVDERARLEAEKAYHAKMVSEIEQSMYPEIFEEKCEIVLDLAIYAPHIMLDGKRYMHGARYTVPRSVYQVLKEQEQHTHRHLESLKQGDDYTSFYRRERALNGMKNDPNSVQISSNGGVTAGGRPYAARPTF